MNKFKVKSFGSARGVTRLNNMSFGVVLLLFVIIGMPVLLQSVHRRRDSDAAPLYAMMCASNALWCIFNALFYVVPNESEALVLFDLRLVFIYTSSLFTYLFVLKTLRHITPKRRVMSVLFAVPALTGVLVLTNPQLHLVRVSLVMEHTGGVRVAAVQSGLWFWVHTLVCYILMVMTFVLILRQIMHTPRSYRASLAIMMGALTVVAVCAMLSVLNVIPYGFDVSPLVVQAAQIVFFYTLFHSHSLDMLFTSREAVFEHADHAIFILGPDEVIVDYNVKAAEIGRRIEKNELYGLFYPDVLRRWLCAFSGRSLDENSSIVGVQQDGAESCYQLSSGNISDRRGRLIGFYAEIHLVTPTMSLLHKLQDYAYFDQLTGLKNRHSFTECIKGLNGDAGAPLGLVVGDVNRLKMVNDRYGHVAGDDLLRAVTAILHGHSSPQLQWFRVGGDEFVGLAFGIGEEQLGRTVEQIRAECERLEDPRFFGVGLALAYRMRTDPRQNLQELLRETDIAMYREKNDRRKRT